MSFTYEPQNVTSNMCEHVRPAKIQISLRIRAVWSESLLGLFLTVNCAKLLNTDNEDSRQTAQVRRLV